MKILHVCRPAVGGIQRWLAEMLPRLRSAGFEVALASPRSVHEAIPDIKWHEWDIPDRPSPGDLLLAMRLNMLSRNYDVVHIHGLRSFGAASMMPPQRSVLMLHNMPPAKLGGIKTRLFGHGLMHCRRIIGVSQAVVDAWLDFYPHCAEIACVLPGGVPKQSAANEQHVSELKNRFRIDSNEPLLLCVARLMPDKGVDLLVQAIAQIPAIRAVIVGDGPDMAMLKEMAEHLAPGRIFFEGYQADISSYLAAADFACLPSRREGQGLFPLEAMSAHLPIVVSDSGGLPECVTDGLTGWTFHAGEVDNLIRVLLKALRHREEWSAIGRIAAAEVSERYDWGTLCDKLSHIYREIGDRK